MDMFRVFAIVKVSAAMKEEKKFFRNLWRLVANPRFLSELIAIEKQLGPLFELKLIAQIQRYQKYVL